MLNVNEGCEVNEINYIKLPSNVNILRASHHITLIGWGTEAHHEYILRVSMFFSRSCSLGDWMDRWKHNQNFLPIYSVIWKWIRLSINAINFYITLHFSRILQLACIHFLCSMKFLRQPEMWNSELLHANNLRNGLRKTKC